MCIVTEIQRYSSDTGLRLYIHTLYIDPYCLRVCVPLTEPDAQGAEVHECRSERQAV